MTPFPDLGLSTVRQVVDVDLVGPSCVLSAPSTA